MKIYKYWLLVILLSACGQSTDRKESSDNLAQSSDEKPLSVAMADSEIERTPDPRLIDFREEPKWEYTNGLICSAMIKVYNNTGDSKYYNYAKSYADSMINADGTIKTYDRRDFNIDRINPGKFLIELYNDTQDPKYLSAIKLLRSQMQDHPRTSEGGFWHKKRYPHQMWLDGLYMGAPFLAQYAMEFNEPKLFDDVALQIKLIDKHTYDSAKNLFYHGWDESHQQKWADPETGLSPHFWGRAMGWYAMALVDVLDFFPADHPERQNILNVLTKMAGSIKQYQDENSGVWYQVLDLGDREGNYLEASCSSMFTYFLLKSVKNEYLSDEYSEIAQKGYDGILDNFIEKNDDGTISLTQICGVAGLGGEPYRDASFEYYVNEPIRENDPKGVGPFIMAALLYEAKYGKDNHLAIRND
ncbi:glycoside hydrolase family 88/105 protein [Marinigracilibium pacificum]|uniref:Glycoside hydrolase family 88 protein n=1 Tax=Marinigracilibium pacificum TaxID=2729599 RepID=A0A848J2Y7_9BACT|nr:glycoside hydrolase family 88 protein [Marinigracilibium pacificum]NMM49698.1 glycoside hydrolase family 88 protein [Marinigracilibium pacificum]